jgi:uncharacterized protein YoxC
MKSFIKILAAFLFVFLIGIFITYKSINRTFKKVEKEHLIVRTSSSILHKTIILG